MNYFKWFELPEEYALEMVELQDRYDALSKKIHPDNFQSKSGLEMQLAQQAMQYHHKAYETLYCPIKRLAYILLLNNIDLASEQSQKQAFSPDFLEKIFEWQSLMHDKNTKIEIEKNIAEKLLTAIHLVKQSHFELATPLAREILFMKKILEQS